MDPNSALSKTFGDDFDGIERELKTALSSRVPLIEDIGNYVLLGRGKRIRPLFFLISSRLCGYGGDDAHRLSTIFEYVHVASLLHDDVLDNAEIRRKKPSANALWGNHAAVLEGDFLYSIASSLALSSNSEDFMRRLTDTTTRMTEGQILELIHTNNWHTTKNDYIKIITAKTAVLISAACACGALISGADSKVEHALAEFGLNVGIAFQLIDDLLDYTSSEKVFGKPVGKDVREGKITLPLIYALKQLEEQDREALKMTFVGRKASDTELERLIEFVRNNGSLDRIREEARKYGLRAERCLDIFPDSRGRRELLELSRYMLERTF